MCVPRLRVSLRTVNLAHHSPPYVSLFLFFLYMGCGKRKTLFRRHSPSFPFLCELSSRESPVARNFHRQQSGIVCTSRLDDAEEAEAKMKRHAHTFFFFFF